MESERVRTEVDVRQHGGREGAIYEGDIGANRGKKWEGVGGRRKRK